jgi:hypothetical protein
LVRRIGGIVSSLTAIYEWVMGKAMDDADLFWLYMDESAHPLYFAGQ